MTTHYSPIEEVTLACGARRCRKKKDTDENLTMLAGKRMSAAAMINPTYLPVTGDDTWIPLSWTYSYHFLTGLLFLDALPPTDFLVKCHCGQLTECALFLLIGAIFDSSSRVKTGRRIHPVIEDDAEFLGAFRFRF
jgi:hypothetical protein